MAAKKRAKKASPDGRDVSGRFIRGNGGGPGNPNIRRLSEFQRAAREAVSAEDLTSILRELAGIAVGRMRAAIGDDPDALTPVSASDRINAAKVVLERVLGKPQTYATAIDMPAIKSAKDIPAAFAAVLAAVTTGNVSIEQMAEHLRVLEGARAAFGEAAMRREVDELREIVSSLEASR